MGLLAGVVSGCANLVYDPSPKGDLPGGGRGAPPPVPASTSAAGTSQKSGASGGNGRRSSTPPVTESPVSPPVSGASRPAPKPASTTEVGGAVADTVRRNREAGRLVFRAGDRTVLEFQAQPLLPAGVPENYRRGGYIARILTPSGRVISDDFPAKHIHHHGIWAAWTKTVFEGRQPDFWNMGEGKGRVQFLSTEVATPTHIRSRQRYVDMTIQPEKSVLEESFDVQLRPSLGGIHPAYVFDVTLTQNALTSSPLELPEYLYGGLGFRGNAAWDGAANCQFLTSEGISDRVQAHATKARWCHISGLVDGQRAGVAILCHPGNFRAPQPMRVHPTEPFFCYAPPAGGAFSIQPGQTYTARYRCVVFDGAPDRSWIDQQWTQYANGR